MKDKKWTTSHRIFAKFDPRKKMKCLNPGSHNAAAMVTGDFSANEHSSRTDDGERRSESSNIEEAESSLREGDCLNYEEARALLGRLEYQRGNIQAALHVFDGIDIVAITPKLKISIARRIDCHKPRSHWSALPMSIHAVSLLMEAIFLKARALHDIGKFIEAAQSLDVILDIVQSASPKGLPAVFSRNCKLQEIVCKAIELLPEIWKLADHPHGAISSYRRALLGHWNLDLMTISKIRKEFAIFLLYGGCDASPPNLHSQMDGYFTPNSNLEEAIHLLVILLSDFNDKKVEWDPAIVEHLTFALTISGQLRPLANQFEELLPGVLHRKERYYQLALCYLGEGDNLTALNLLKKILSDSESSTCVKSLLLCSKICGENSAYAEEGISFSRRILSALSGRCHSLGSVAHCLLGISLSAQTRSSASDSERVPLQDEALKVLEKAEKMMQIKDSRVIYHLSLENAEQRKLDVALRYAKQLLKLEAGSNLISWILVARILSAQKRFTDAEAIINAAIDQAGKWSHGELLQTKAKVQIAQGQLKEAVETYTNLLAIIRLRTKNMTVGMECSKIAEVDRRLEIETWHDLANAYVSMSWRDAEVCISKLKAISPYTPLGWHATGKLEEAKGLYKEALQSYSKALDLEPTHVPSLVSTAIVLRHCGDRPFSVLRVFRPLRLLGISRLLPFLKSRHQLSLSDDILMQPQNLIVIIGHWEMEGKGNVTKLLLIGILLIETANIWTGKRMTLDGFSSITLLHASGLIFICEAVE